MGKEVFAGIDYGTSNCLAATIDGDEPKLVPLENGDTNLLSAVYAATEEDLLPEVDEAILQKRIAGAKAQQRREKKSDEEKFREYLKKELTDQEIRSREIGVLKREIAAQDQEKGINETLRESEDIRYGWSALKAHLQDPDNGYFVKSPKAFLGADLRPYDKDRFVQITTKILSYIKRSIEQSENAEVKNAVIGRPVSFYTKAEEKRDKQAIDILNKGSMAAGFQGVEFVVEPVAAALEYERTLSSEKVVLVFDAGGGTTDCTMMKLGPSEKQESDRLQSVIGVAGIRLGGTDIDIKLAYRDIMPIVGKELCQDNGLPLPAQLFWDAAAVNDVNAQMRFYSEFTRRDIDYFSRTVGGQQLKRLKKLQKQRLTMRLNRSAELAKIYLSDKTPITLPLKYLEKDLDVKINRKQLKEAARIEIDQMANQMEEAVKKSGVQPDALFLTGGTARSPIMRTAIREKFPKTPIHDGDHSGSVVKGLALWGKSLL